MFKEVVTETASRAKYLLPRAALVSTPYVAHRYTVDHVTASSFVWPPLGILDIYSVPAATIVILLCSCLPRVVVTKTQINKWFIATATIAVLFFICYSALVGRYVIGVQTPSDGFQVRSIGCRVEPRIRALYPDKNDLELLRIGGLQDWQIQKVWTPASVLVVRLSILTTFALTLGIANMSIGVAAIRRPR